LKNISDSEPHNKAFAAERKKLRPLKSRSALPDDMKEVTKEQFKEIYFKLGGGEATGWGPEYWNKFFEDEKSPGMRYLLEEHETPEHRRMMIVTDYERNEHRLFFLTEESEESLFDFPNEG
jgi:hypothetical protein